MLAGGLLSGCLANSDSEQSALTAALIASNPDIAALIEANPDMPLGWTEDFWDDALLQAPAYPGSLWRVHDLGRPQPPLARPEPCLSSAPPTAAVGLFEGDSIDKFEGDSLTLWSVEGGTLVASGQKNNRIATTHSFGDVQVHLEFRMPTPTIGHGQFRGNSGLFLMGKYEVQILDSFDNPTYADGQLGAVYGQTPPLANAGAAPGEWQCMDVTFTAPRFEGETLISPARVTVDLNGVRVQNETEILGPTRFAALSTYQAHEPELPLTLQDHGDPGSRVAFRNIWALPLTSDPDE